MGSKSVYAGVDVGASRTKVAILDGKKNLIGHAVAKSGTDFAATADTCLTSALKMAGRAAGFKAGVRTAAECIDSGRAREKLNSLRKMSNK